MPRRSRDAAFYVKTYLVLGVVYTVFTRAGAGYILSGVGRFGLYRHEPE